MATVNEDLAGPPPTARPWHLLFVGIVSLLWNAFGAFDYVMTQLRNEAYMSGFPEEQLAYFYGMPVWADIGWALGVWGAVAGSVLLLLKSRWALAAFLLSLAGLLVSALHQIVNPPPASLSGGMMWFAALIWAFTLFLIWYSAAMRKRGVLR
ncbi:hypothetical protein B5C34_14890 [Pacificimonas flava]|uniref:Uncharacterized protein n=2 Tax=Pacificimonas TaxID=1960290 RepID=A0A219B0Q1_9SPHN|nr:MULTISPECIES: hypothetical protein [Pacificimonas]MBZ6379750.1 hypothetical protein [Pacificimonas aurantium]OWV31794.1 hypothetical protein B5C34_14890 [Pacificimonas flava]